LAADVRAADCPAKSRRVTCGRLTRPHPREPTSP
jgi:hypothetical protein